MNIQNYILNQTLICNTLTRSCAKVILRYDVPNQPPARLFKPNVYRRRRVLGDIKSVCLSRLYLLLTNKTYCRVDKKIKFSVGRPATAERTPGTARLEIRILDVLKLQRPQHNVCFS